MSRHPAERCTCPIGGFSHECPRHGLKEKPEKKAATRTALKPSRLKGRSEKGDERAAVWKVIKRSMILAQERTNGYTSCMGCGAQNPEPLDLDHIFPTGKGGKWEPDNAQLLCRPCHNAKHRTLPEWTKTVAEGA